jgi:glyoxylase-like metal-dependent hydrolase (beta-lactamase superfamily II)
MQAALLLVGFQAWAQDLPPLVHRAADGVYYRQSEDDKKIIATTSWIEFHDFIVVVDANYPWGAVPILRDLRKTTTKPVRFVLDTHYHADHSYGNGVFAEQGATIVSSDDTAADSRNRNTPSWEKNKDTGVFNLKQYRLVHPQLTFHDKLVIDDGGRRLELIRVGPAHTRGDVVAWLPKERILFTGDVCTTRAQNNLSDPGMDPEGWVRVLGQLAEMNPAIVIPGHGIQGTVDALNGQRAYLAAMIEQVKAGVARQETPEQIINGIDWKKYKPWSDEEKRNRADIAVLYEKFKSR